MFAQHTLELARTVVSGLTALGKTLSVAESCTGGLIGGAITAVPGSSSVFLGGVIAYSNEIKQRMLRVPGEALEAHGAVSGETVRAMADGAAAVTGSDYAVSVSGIAGPDGGTPQKPVGLVFIGLRTPKGTEAFEHRFDGDREAVRLQAVETALSRVVEAVLRGG
ncbi:MAG: nicotinamide-nucleotide amidohydrolase family protein [Chitinivibrionales bacterium]|nr:nicotinamide-nucleotide amidohydrolase family protein [Chitinivibrionales bacterium]